jgi:hypothetical protein
MSVRASTAPPSSMPTDSFQTTRRNGRETGEEAQAIPFLERFTVFNLAQCEGLPRDLITTPPPEPGLTEPKVEALIKATGIDFRIAGSPASTCPRTTCAGASAATLFRAHQLAPHGASRVRSLCRVPDYAALARNRLRWALAPARHVGIIALSESAAAVAFGRL